MDFNTTIGIILKDLREVREIIDDFKNYPDVPLLQVELAKAKCKSAEEVISLLKVIRVESRTTEAESKKPVVTDQHKSADTLIEISDEECETGQEDTSAVIYPAEEEINTVEPGPAGREEAVGEIPGRDTETEPVITRASAKPSKGEKHIFADQFNGIQQTFLDQFGTEAGDSTTHLIKDRKITSLSDAIGVNDKFVFIREIFGGDRQAYEDTVSRLEKVSSAGEALNILIEFAPEGDYNEHVGHLLEIIKRKLPADE